MKKSIFIITLTLVIISTCCTAVQADDDTAQSLKQQVGQYTIEFQHDHSIKTGEPVWFNFFLSQNNSPTSFSYIEETVSKDNKILSKTNISKIKKTATGITLDFPYDGTYQLGLSFYSGDTLLAQTSFDFNVAKSSIPIETTKTNSLSYFMYAIIGTLTGFVISYFFVKLRKIELSEQKY